ncbi:MAG: right-handed parallel beta-helix repeat-containing protein, partial [Candidatus Hermodarchaeota archaeon]
SQPFVPSVGVSLPLQNDLPHFSATDTYIDWPDGNMILGGNDGLLNLAELYDWPGDGTPQNPIIIDGYRIFGGDDLTALEITGIDLHFRVQNCQFVGIGKSSGIVIYGDTSNGYFFNNELYNFINAILVWDCHHIEFDSNEIHDNEVGIWSMFNTDSFLVTSNHIYQNWIAIYIFDSSSWTFSNNNIHDTDQGITCSFSQFNIISDNFLSCTWANIFLDYSSGNTISGNILVNQGISIWGDEPAYCLQSNVQDNVVDGKPIIFAQSQTGGTVPDASSAGQIILVDCDGVEISGQTFNGIDGTKVLFFEALVCRNIRITNNMVANSYLAFRFSHSTQCVVSSNVNVNGFCAVVFQRSSNCDAIANDLSYILCGFSDNLFIYDNDLNLGYGIEMYWTNNSVISFNRISNNQIHGIYLYISESNVFEENEIESSELNGIQLDESHYNEFRSNTISSCGYKGIRLDCAHENILDNNIIHDNLEEGIILFFSNNNMITSNHLYNNLWEGVGIIDSIQNTLFNNNIDNNREGVGIWASTNIKVIQNTISNNNEGHGISLGDSSFCNISFNDIYSNNLHGINFETVQDTEVSNNNIFNNGQDGIRLWNSNSNELFLNTIYGNIRGFLLLTSLDCNILENDVYNNYAGIYVRLSSNCRFQYNHITDNQYGLGLSRSKNNYVLDNTFTNDGMYIYGFSIDEYIQLEFERNTVNGKPIIFWLHKNSGTVPMGAGQVILVNCHNIIVENQVLTSAATGLHTAFCSNLQIRFNEFSNNNFEGFWLWYTDNSVISENIAFNNIFGALGLYYSTNNTLVSNDLYNNFYYGVFLGSNSENNSLFYNNIVNNELEGIYIEGGVNRNKISWNNFIGNNPGGNCQAYDIGIGNLISGNYWSDFTSPDINGDGIVDSPYAINPDGSNSDPFPYVNENGWNFLATPADTDVEVTEYTSGVSVIFDEVLVGGTSSITISNYQPETPMGFTATGIYYQVATTASYTGLIEIAIPYYESQITGEEEHLRLLHWNEVTGEWEDVTTWVDVINNIIQGEVTSLSIFSVMVSIDTEPPEIIGGFIPLDIDDDGGLFEIFFSATDNFDPSPSVYAVLLLPQIDNPEIKFEVKKKIEIKFDLEAKKIKISAPNPEQLWVELQTWGGLKVSSKQLIEIDLDEDDNEKVKFEKDNSLIEVEGYIPTLKVVAEDQSANLSEMYFTPVIENDEDDNDD